MGEHKLEPGIKGTATGKVTRDKTAAEMKSGDVHVFATPAMIAIMEEAAVACVSKFLPDDQTSVGTFIEVRHLAATPEKMAVKAEAVLEKIDGKKLTFKITAFDEKEKIGEGIHERFIVNRSKFMERVNSKK